MRVMLASWALAAALTLHGAAAFAPNGVQLPATRLAGSSMPLGQRASVARLSTAAKRTGAAKLNMMAAQPKIIQGGMGVQVSSANDWPKRQRADRIHLCGHGREGAWARGSDIGAKFVAERW